MQRFSVFHGSPEDILKAWHRPYAELLADSSPVLDIGCGLGYFADILRDREVQCVGVDIDPAMVQASKERGHTAHVGDQRSLDKLGTEFGAVHISHVVEHLWGEEVIELLEKSAAVLRPGGRIVVRTPNFENAEVRRRMFWSDYSHRRPYNVEVLGRLLTDLGFTVDAAGPEPYGHNDLYVVATKGKPKATKTKPDFSRNPFPRPSLRERYRRGAPAWLQAALRPAWRAVTKKRE